MRGQSLSRGASSAARLRLNSAGTLISSCHVSSLLFSRTGAGQLGIDHTSRNAHTAFPLFWLPASNVSPLSPFADVTSFVDVSAVHVILPLEA